MNFIWFNPDRNIYELGTGDFFKSQRSLSNNPNGFTLLYKMTETTLRVGEKLIRELNRARVENVANQIPVHAA